MPSSSAKHAALVDVRGDVDFGPQQVRRAHVDDVVPAQIGFAAGAGAFRDDQIEVALEIGDRFLHRGEAAGVELRREKIILRGDIRDGVAVDEELRGVVGLGLHQQRVHVHDGAFSCGAGLHGGGAADLLAFVGDEGVERHVLGFERGDAEPATCEQAAEAGDQHGFADVRAGAEDHDGLEHGRGLYSGAGAGCARVPAGMLRTRRVRGYTATASREKVPPQEETHHGCTHSVVHHVPHALPDRQRRPLGQQPASQRPAGHDAHAGVLADQRGHGVAGAVGSGDRHAAGCHGPGQAGEGSRVAAAA